jgi:GT2 family glycosyltransferase
MGTHLQRLGALGDGLVLGKSSADLTIAIVMPAYNAVDHLPKVIPAARAAAAEDCRIVVVDPGSDDGTPDLAETLGAEVYRLGHRAGPAEARNFGVSQVDSDVVLFIDSDCVAHGDVVQRVREAFASDPNLVTMTGSYDDVPPDPGFFSGYMNLRHHFTHQNAETENASFWAGCGAVRRDAFLAVGGFDAERFPMPEIEDIELSSRLCQKGRTILDPALNVTHLKRWTLKSVVMTDIFQRAIPWSRLINEQDEMPNDLNLRLAQRIAAALAPLALASLLVLPLSLFAGFPLVGLVCAAILATSIALHFPMIRCFARARGPLFALGGWAFQQVHLTYSAVTFVACRVF